jgi:hypothetical protein
MAGVGGLTGDSRGSLLVVVDALCAAPHARQGKALDPARSSAREARGVPHCFRGSGWTRRGRTGAKLFAGMYALYADLVFLVGAGLIFAPVVRRVMRKFHWEQ